MFSERNNSAHLRVCWFVILLLLLLLAEGRLKMLCTTCHFLLDLAKEHGVDVPLVELRHNAATLVLSA